MIGAFFQTFTLLGSEWVMWVLLALSVLSFAVIFERMRNLSNQEKLGARLWKEKIDPMMAAGAAPEFKGTLAETYPCVEGALIDALVKGGKANSEQAARLTQSFLGKKKLELEKNLSFLGTVGSNAPFIGLFGTVLGIIRAFHDMGGKVESAGASTISAGLSEALVATAIGLMVAIPAVVFFNFFQRKIKTILGRAESLSNYLISARAE